MVESEGPKDNAPVGEDEWLSCLDIPEQIKKVPVGKIHYTGQEPIYVDGNAHQFTRQEYINTHAVDPEEVWQEIKQRRADAGKIDNIKQL